jgi:hypothetical protein
VRSHINRHVRSYPDTQGPLPPRTTAIGNTLYAVGGATKAGHNASTNLLRALTFSKRPSRLPLVAVMDNDHGELALSNVRKVSARAWACSWHSA